MKNSVGIGLIGGSGFDSRKLLSQKRTENVKTPYGNVDVAAGKIGRRRVVAINRHKDGVSIPAHRINHRANLLALWWLGVRRIISTSAVGAINRRIRPGQLVLVDQYIHLGAPPITFFDGEYGVRYSDMTKPYCPEIGGNITDAFEKMSVPFFSLRGLYVCANGPQFETPAEIKFYARMGADVIGMTNPPEAKLARELGICYRTICVVANYAAGISSKPLSEEDVYKTMADSARLISDVILYAVIRLGYNNFCQCKELGGSTEKLAEVMRDLNK